MTVKEYNKIRREVFDVAMQNDEIRRTVEENGVAYIVDMTEPSGKHGFLVLSQKTQINDSVLEEHGFDAETTTAKITMTLNRQTKCATF